MAVDIDTLNSWKNFLADRPEYAFLTLSVLGNIVLFRLLMKAKDAHITLALQLAPLAERLLAIIQKAARVRAGRVLPQTPPRADGE